MRAEVTENDEARLSPNEKVIDSVKYRTTNDPDLLLAEKIKAPISVMYHTEPAPALPEI